MIDAGRNLYAMRFLTGIIKRIDPLFTYPERIRLPIRLAFIAPGIEVANLQPLSLWSIARLCATVNEAAIFGAMQ